MLSIWCQDCGQESKYSAKKPNFCTSCGNPFSMEAAEKRKKQVVLAPVQDDEDGAEDNGESDGRETVPQITSLDFEIDFQKPSTETVGSVMKNPAAVSPIKGSGKKMSKEEQRQFLADFQRESSAIKPNSRTHIVKRPANE